MQFGYHIAEPKGDRLDTLTSRFACQSCGKTYAWKPALAGRRAKCACGHVMVAPDASPAAEVDEDLYDVVDDSPPVAVATTPAIPMIKAVNYARAETVGESAVDRYFPDRVKDLYLPLFLIAGGTIIELAVALMGRSRSLAFAMGAVGTFMVINTIIMLLTVMVVAKIRAINFGPVPTALIKLCGLSIGPGAVGSLLSLVFSWIPIIGALSGWIAGCILYFALFGAMFDLDESDTWVVVLSVFFVRLALFVGLVLFLR